MQCRNLRPHGRVFLSAAIAALCCLPVETAWTQAQVPPGATPGANLPRTPEPPPAMSAAPADVYSVPRKLDRPVGADEGPRVAVTRFDLSGAVDRKDAGIKVVDIQALLEKLRAAQPEGGFTIVQLEGVAEEVTKFYRTRGLILAQAYVPVQDVTGGVVKVGVFEGKLGEVTVEGNKRYKTKAIQNAFDNIIGQPVDQQDAEEALFILNDYPGLDVYGVFQPGKEVGTTTLAIQARREDSVEYSFGVDNYGIESTGDTRAVAGLTLNAPFGYGDQLNVYATYGIDPSDSAADSLFGGIEYVLPVQRTSSQLAIRYSRNDYNVGGELSDFSGNSQNAEAEWAALLKRSRTVTARASLAARAQTGKVEAGDSALKDEVRSATARLELSHIDTRFRGVNRFEAGVTYGEVTNQDNLVNTRTDLAEKFSHWNVLLERWQRLGDSIALVMNARAQWSGDRLTSFDQVSMGGPTNVRGYPSSTFLGDEGASATAEFIFDAPGFSQRKGWKDHTWGEMLKFHLFADYALVKVNGVPAGSTTLIADEDFSSYGGGISFALPGRMTARVDVSQPFTSDDEVLDGVAVPSETQVFFTVGFTF